MALKKEGAGRSGGKGVKGGSTGAAKTPSSASAHAAQRGIAFFMKKVETAKKEVDEKVPSFASRKAPKETVRTEESSATKRKESEAISSSCDAVISLVDDEDQPQAAKKNKVVDVLDSACDHPMVIDIEAEVTENSIPLGSKRKLVENGDSDPQNGSALCSKPSLAESLQAKAPQSQIQSPDSDASAALESAEKKRRIDESCPAPASGSDLSDKCSKYEEELAGVVRLFGEREAERLDCRVDIEAAVQLGLMKLTEAPDESATGFPEVLAPALARIVQGSAATLIELASDSLGVLHGLLSSCEAENAELAPRARALRGRLDQSCVEEKIRFLAERKAYGKVSKKATVMSDTDPGAAWIWEVQCLDLLSDRCAADVKQLRKSRRTIGMWAKALNSLLTTLRKHPDDPAKISQDEEKVMSHQRAMEKENQKRLAQELKHQEKQAKALEKEQKKAAAKAAKAAKAVAAKETRDEPAPITKTLLNFFKKAPPPATKAAPADAINPADGQAFSAALTYADVVCDEEQSFRSQLFSNKPLQEIMVDVSRFRSNHQGAERNKAPWRRRVSLQVHIESRDGGSFGAATYVEQREVSVGGRMKLLAFREDVRPPYWGTWSKQSRLIAGRRPLAKDEALLDYDYDSEAEWEEADEDPGEELASGDEEEEGAGPEVDDLDYDDGWLRHDDDMGSCAESSDSEGELGSGKHKESIAACTFRIRKPLCIGVLLFGGRKDEAAAPDLLLRYAVRLVHSEAEPHSLPLAAESAKTIALNLGSTSKPPGPAGRPRVPFPDELLPYFVSTFHGKSERKENLINKFVAEHPKVTKKAVSTKLKEVVTREKSVAGGGKVVWVVRQETIDLAASFPMKEGATLDATGSAAAADASEVPALLTGQRSLSSFLKKAIASAPLGPAASDSPPVAEQKRTSLSPSPSGLCEDGGWLEHKPSPPPSAGKGHYSSPASVVAMIHPTSEDKGASTCATATTQHPLIVPAEVCTKSMAKNPEYMKD